MTQAIGTHTQATTGTLKALKCKECGTEYELEATHVVMVIVLRSIGGNV